MKRILPSALITDRSQVYLPTPIGKFSIDRPDNAKKNKREKRQEKGKVREARIASIESGS